MTQENKDKKNHEKSLVLAKMFKELYAQHGGDNMLVKELRDQYVAARRDISVGEDGKRYGASEAYEAMR